MNWDRIISIFRLFGVRYPLPIICLVLASMMRWSFPPADPMPDLALIVYNVAALFGGTVIVLQFLRLIYRGQPMRFSDLYQILERVLWLLFCLTIVDTGAALLDALVRSIAADPAPFVAVGMGFVAAMIAVSRASDRSDDPVLAQTMRGAAEKRQPRSDADIFRIAVHEAGHAMLFAALPSMPSTISVSVCRDEGADDMYRGAVTHMTEHPGIRTDAYIRWQMLLSLSGMVAELAILGDRADGGAKDSKEWLEHAAFYLSNGLGEVWWQSPSSESELAHNRQVLSDLRDGQVAQLLHLFRVNHDLLVDMATSLARSGLIEKDELSRYLSAVRLTASIRKLSGPE